MTEHERIDFAARLRRRREKRGWTQAVLARRARVGRLTVIRAERGSVVPSYGTVVLLANALGIGDAVLTRSEIAGGEE